MYCDSDASSLSGKWGKRGSGSQACHTAGKWQSRDASASLSGTKAVFSTSTQLPGAALFLKELCSQVFLCHRPPHSLPHAASLIERVPLIQAFTAVYNAAMFYPSKETVSSSLHVYSCLWLVGPFPLRMLTLPICPTFPAAAHPTQRPCPRFSPIFQLLIWAHSLHELASASPGHTAVTCP